MRFIKALSQLNRLPEIGLCRTATPQWLRLTACYVGLPVKFPFDIKLKTGKFQFLTLADVRTFWCVFFSNVYNVNRTDKLLVDAGANIGTFTLYALLKAPESHVIAIEPAPDTCKRLRDVLHEHGLNSRCTIHEAALGSQIGTTTIDLKPESQFRSTGHGSGVQIPMVTLDHIVPDGTIDMVKLDVEGAEYTIITSGAANCLRRVKRMTMEFHPNGSIQDLLGPLAHKGLSCISIRDDGDAYGIASFERA